MLICALQGLDAHHLTKYNQDAARLLNCTTGCHHTTHISDHGSQLIRYVGFDFTEGGKPENPEKTPRSAAESNCNNSTHAHKFQVRESTRGYTQVVTHPAISRSDQA